MKPNLKLLVVSVTLGYVLSNAHAVGTRKFIQVSDFHLDLDYKEKSSVKSFCHTSLDDIQASDDDLPTIYGHNRCDSPARLVKATIRQMRKVLPDPDFILWTGDNRYGHKCNLYQHRTFYRFTVIGFVEGKINDPFSGRAPLALRAAQLPSENAPELVVIYATTSVTPEKQGNCLERL